MPPEKTINKIQINTMNPTRASIHPDRAPCLGGSFDVSGVNLCEVDFETGGDCPVLTGFGLFIGDGCIWAEGFDDCFLLFLIFHWVILSGSESIL
jgi:hypothetical protein